VDGSPIVGDVYAKFDGFTDEWRTMLVIGEREGGEAYFALDVTSGKRFDDMNPTKFLWEFTDDELGQTWSDPAIDRVEIDGVLPADGTAWGVFFGSGYMPIAAEQATKEAYLYGVHAHDASPLWKDKDSVPINRIKITPISEGTIAYDGLTISFDTPSQVGGTVTGWTSGATGIIVSVNVIVPGSHGTITLKNITGSFKDNEWINSSGGGEAKVNGTISGVSGALNDAMASPLVVDLEADYVGDRIYVGNLYGDMYRVANIGKNMTPQVTTLFTYGNTSPYKNPIRAKADFAYSETDGEVWIYFGSGRYETQADKLDDNQQYFFGLKDGQTPAATYTPAGLVSLQGKFVIADIEGTSKTLRYVDGDNEFAESWKMQLYEGTFPDGPLSSGTERVISRPLAVAGMVLFTTFIPDENICAGSGETWVFAVDYKSGLAATEPVFDLNGDGKFDDNDKVEIDGELVVPIGILAGRGQGSPPVLHKDTLFITTTGDGEGGDGGQEFFAQKVNLSQQKVRVEAWREN
jgi:Tfp pilus tip-associated adhesin PilY1